MFAPTSKARRAVVAAVGAIAATLALCVAGAGVASADTPQPAFPNSARVHLSFYPIPTKPSKSVTPGSLPQYEGTMGDPTEVFLGNGKSQQALTAVSNARNSDVTTAPATGGTNQTWYIQQVGWVAGTSRNNNTMQLLVYKIIRYDNAGGHSCLDALGGSGAAGTRVGLCPCDPHAVNQANQLWMIAGDSQWRTRVDPTTGAVQQGNLTYMPPFSSAIPGLSDDYYLSSAIVSVASLQANGWQSYGLPLLSAAVDNVQGINSSLALLDTDWLSPANSSYLFNDVKQPSDDSHAKCTLFGCLVNM